MLFDFLEFFFHLYNLALHADVVGLRIVKPDGSLIELSEAGNQKERDMLAAAQQKVSGKDAGRIDLRVMDAEAMDFADGAFDAGPAEPELVLDGQVAGLYNAATFSAKNADGALIGERRWEPDAALGHLEATDYIGDFLRTFGARRNKATNFLIDRINLYA